MELAVMDDTTTATGEIYALKFAIRNNRGTDTVL